MRELCGLIQEKTGGEITAEFLLESQKMAAFHDSIKRLKIKLDGSYGCDLEGHWFYIVPADEHAEKAMINHNDSSKMRRNR